MTPEISDHLNKARGCLNRARLILDAEVGEDDGRNAYLAAFHAAQALILARTNKFAKTHRGVHRQFFALVQDDPDLADLARFLSQAYDLKSIADYDVGPDTGVSLDRAAAAIETAQHFVDRVIELLT